MQQVHQITAEPRGSVAITTERDCWPSSSWLDTGQTSGIGSWDSRRLDSMPAEAVIRVYGTIRY
jgi:hypothetical protein